MDQIWCYGRRAMGSDSIADMSYRQVMAQWATGVSIITTHGAEGADGCTVNSLTSLSLEPPLILVCLDLASNTLATLRSSRRFGVNILAAGQAAISNHFAVKTNGAGAKFAGVPYNLIEGVPMIEGALGCVVCELADELPGGDHAILTGRPVCAELRDGARPLIFFQRSYWEPAPVSPLGSRSAA
jgi:flavin reductase (DIM6/NTAB) family NADH-FMN oxidoreductase RutF